MTREAGLDGVVPFRFECQRSGRCCSGGTGHVWVEECEVAGLAAALGMSAEAFARRHLRRTRDPRGGLERLSLCERGAAGDAGAACVLLEGGQTCTVYEARPAHCRQYPHWPSILGDREAFEAARATCPGITPLPAPERREAAFRALEELYVELDRAVADLQPLCVRSGLCCRFEQAGHELFATNLEADYAQHTHPDAPAPEAPGRCPYHVGGACTAREGRPLGCRTYFCDARTEERLAALHEQFLARIRRIERQNEYPAGYARFPVQLARRGVGSRRATLPEGASPSESAAPLERTMNDESTAEDGET